MRGNKLFRKVLITGVLITFFNLTGLFCQGNSTIGLTMKFAAPIGPREKAEVVYFIKIEEDSNLLEVKSVIRSTFYEGNQIYLTEVKPGKYAIVATGKEKVVPYYGDVELTVYFSEDLIKKTIVTVNASDFVYMGNYYIKTKMLQPNKDLDKAQLHYYRLITGDLDIPSYLSQTIGTKWHYRGLFKKLENTKTDKNDFIMEALKHFQGMEQEEIIKKKMNN